MQGRSVAAPHRADPELIGAVRRFNRFYTRQLGLLDKSLPGSEWTLAEARVLYELVRRESTTASAIAAELGLDVAYLSRILSKFEQRRFLRRRRSTEDARKQSIRLTARGRSAFRPLDRSARDQIAAMLTPVAPADRHSLVAAMQGIERALQPTTTRTPGPCTIRALRIGDIGWITHRQGILYAEEYGWDATYEALVAEILAAFLKNFNPRFDAAWIAERGGVIVGSVFLVRASAGTCKLRLLYVEPQARGLGLGRRLVAECIRGARARGYRTLTLWTNDVLVSARRIYEAAGFKLVKEEKHRSFGKDLMGQTWTLRL